ncbi:uncharacterized protein SCHCODRAFT_02706840 [Schizophyllum commune H4-8]|nr:uncharacterized protein SCHCODRAFT_02706840 [Schizophyllum commune H4-8]KAI5885324.1 hypothetical protein SCHCODRAFT_02706840 [Schizophyllum commune H4-8]
MATDSLADLWRGALDAYERRAGIKLSSPGFPPFASSDEIFEFIDSRRTEFSNFREDGQQLRSKLEPIAWTVQTLCSILGEAFAVPFSPGKAIFTAIGVALQAAMKVQKDFDAIEDAFETMAHHLRIIKTSAAPIMHVVLREASLKLLVQILAILGVITEMQKSGRLTAWLRSIRHSDVLDKALEELRQLATNQHQTISAVTLLVSQRTLSIFTDSAAWNDADNILRTFLERVLDTTREIYDLLRKSASATQRQNTANRRILEDIQNKLFQLNEEVLKKKSYNQGRIYEWLQYPDCSAKINALLYERARGTGSWFFDSNEFSAFKAGKKRVLLLQGSAGCGKSTIMAGAICELRAHCALVTPQSLVLTHFFDATNPNLRHRNLEGLSSSLLCQLSHHGADVLEALQTLHDNLMAGRSEISLDKVQCMLDAALQSRVARVFVALDALDEAIIQFDSRKGCFLEDLIKHENVSLLLSSRTEVPYNRYLERLSSARLLVKKHLVARDIAVHLDDVLAARGALAKVKGQNISLVRKMLTSRADGNFRWTVLQIQELAGVAGIPTQLRRMLHDMPKTLNDAYDLAFAMMPEAQRDELQRMLEWLLFARGLLDKHEYSELLAFEWSKHSDRDLPVFDTELRPSSPDEIFTIVNSAFVSYYGGFVRIAHASIRDYFLGPRTPMQFSSTKAYTRMAFTCIAYLSAVGTTDTPKKRLLGRYPLHYHARKFWSFYAHKSLKEFWILYEPVERFVSSFPPKASSLLELAVKERHINVLRIVHRVRPDLLEPFHLTIDFYRPRVPFEPEFVSWPR